MAKEELYVIFSTNNIVGNPHLSLSGRVASSLLPDSFKYADSDLFNPNPRLIEILLGNDVRNRFVRHNQDRVLAESLVLKPTFFGWVSSGRAMSMEKFCDFPNTSD